MKVLDAMIKYAARKKNQTIVRKQIEKASDYSYKETGKVIKHARKTGNYVDGSALHRQIKNQRIKDVKRAGRSREKFIDDL